MWLRGCRTESRLPGDALHQMNKVVKLGKAMFFKLSARLWAMLSLVLLCRRASTLQSVAEEDERSQRSSHSSNSNTPPQHLANEGPSSQGKQQNSLVGHSFSLPKSNLLATLSRQSRLEGLDFCALPSYAGSSYEVPVQMFKFCLASLESASMAHLRRVRSLGRGQIHIQRRSPRGPSPSRSPRRLSRSPKLPGLVVLWLKDFEGCLKAV